ncbi:hypothetical protein QVG61_05610 [Thiohalobacter sp. IOR34]|uniref:hypothetical protein n=1 Tax=Thiohalobacter sp. IOR34 TaxID=3057176 RepID=UPI0025AF68EA|nr:hypothetical protein [Thiohalobacter sp. IOR34]WJW76566.1 hypothetical protein QVG61_05610 [Thiohalobacter sp. IOR34]
MTDIEVPEAQWPAFCEAFSLEHHGWLVNVRRVATDLLGRDRAAAIEAGHLLAQEQPLQGISLQPGDEWPRLEVSVGEAGRPECFPVAAVRRLFRERVNEQHQGLRIDASDGQSLLVEFRTPARPESLDGLAASEL